MRTCKGGNLLRLFLVCGFVTFTISVKKKARTNTFTTQNKWFEIDNKIYYVCHSNTCNE